jgi:hypothetical protein
MTDIAIPGERPCIVTIAVETEQRAWQASLAAEYPQVISPQNLRDTRIQAGNWLFDRFE